MSLWELSVAVAGWNKSQGGDNADPPPLSVEEYDADIAAWRELQAEGARLN